MSARRPFLAAAFSLAALLGVTAGCTRASGDGKAAAPAASGQASGTVVDESVTMPVTTAVAVWDADLVALNVYLLAAAPTAEEIAGLQRGFWQVLLKRPGPDLQKWPKAQPYALVSFHWRDNKDKVGQIDQARGALQVWGIAGEDKHHAIMLMEGFGEPTSRSVGLTGPFRDGGPITLTVKYEQDKVAWNVKATTKVLPGT